MKLDILGGSYEQKYHTSNSQRTINWFLVITNDNVKEDSENKFALYTFPGLSAFLTLPGTYFRGFFVAKTRTHNRCFAVVDNVLYEIYSNASYTTRGTMTNLNIGSSKVYMMVDANNELGIFSNSAGYYFNLDTNTLTQITDVNFLGSVDTADYLDGYTIIVSNGTIQYNSASNLSTWNALHIFTPTFRAAQTKAAVAYKEQIHCFTSQTIETYINDSTTPWTRLPRSTIEIGLKAKESLCVHNGGMVFLGENDAGQFGVYTFDGFNSCTSLSPVSITSEWRLLKDELNAAYANIQYTKTGQIFYRLTIPALRTTYVCDLTTGLWVEQQSKQPFPDIDGADVYREFRGKHYVCFKGLNLFGDLYSGKIFLEDESVFTEDGNTILRTRISQNYVEELKYISVNSLELDCTTGYGTVSGAGSTPNVMLQISNDGGYTWSQPKPIPLSTIGNHAFRARILQLGTARRWTIKLTYSDPADIMIQNAVAHGVVGIN